MAIDNLNFYSAWLPAWQQTDRYSSQPWCLRSKNLDIFSSSKSVKATAWSSPSAWDADIVAQDDKWHLVLKTDWKVYEDGVLFVDPSVNFPSYNVSYNGRSWTYMPATFGTVKDMVVKYEWDEWKSFVVFTDRASYTYSKVPYIAEKEFDTSSNLTYDEESPYTEWYMFTKNATSGSSSYILIKMPWVNMATVPIRVYAEQYSGSDTDITLNSITWYEQEYYYDPSTDSMVAQLESIATLPLPEWDIKSWYVEIDIPAAPSAYNRIIRLNFTYTRQAWVSSYWWSWNLYIDMNKPDESYRMATHPDWDYNEYYSYLPIDENRKLNDIWEYYWMPALSFQTLYNWEWTRSVIRNREKKTRYDLVQYMWWANDPAMDVIWMIAWNEQVYMIGNMNWNWYIIPCDLSWGRWTPYIAYWCTFKGVTNIDYLMYLVGDDRWISQLWVYNGQEIVSLVWWKEEIWFTDIINTAEQYKFDWKMVEYRGNLVLSTEDNRIFEYWQTYWGKAWVFIHELPWTIKELKAKGNDLIVKYTEDNTDYTVVYQDSKLIKTYNTERMAEYPIILWNHLLEKEESDLYCSYILPSADCSLEFWGCVNHYHFWTFISEDDYTFDSELSYKMKWATGDYELKFIERNENQYTFKLVWDLPIQTDSEMKITDGEWNELISYSEYNHFRKIWEITTTEYQEWEFRFHNLNNKLELPKSHSLQIMVKGKGNQNYTPELFALDLVANQRERW